MYASKKFSRTQAVYCARFTWRNVMLMVSANSQVNLDLYWRNQTFISRCDTDFDSMFLLIAMVMNLLCNGIMIFQRCSLLYIHFLNGIYFKKYLQSCVFFFVWRTFWRFCLCIIFCWQSGVTFPWLTLHVFGLVKEVNGWYSHNLVKLWISVVVWVFRVSFCGSYCLNVIVFLARGGTWSCEHTLFCTEIVKRHL